MHSSRFVIPRVLLRGSWTPDEISTRWSSSTFALSPTAEAEVNAVWERSQGERSRRLFDGPMCRLEGFAVERRRLSVSISPTSYRLFWGTNVAHPEWADQLGPSAMANPIGVSPALKTADGFLLFGRRNSSVAYYPDRVHPFAGTAEPGVAAAAVDSPGPDLFGEVRRELAEELHLGSGDLNDMRLLGLVEEPRLRQAEFIFGVDCQLTREEVERRLDPTEHRGIVSVAATPNDLEAAVGDVAFTPVAVATLLLWGGRAFGDEWFGRSTR